MQTPTQTSSSSIIQRATQADSPRTHASSGVWDSLESSHYGGPQEGIRTHSPWRLQRYACMRAVLLWWYVAHAGRWGVL
jgi:hypothetical protein